MSPRLKRCPACGAVVCRCDLGITVWTASETKALREARRMTKLAFGAHLGVGGRLVTKWESEGSPPPRLSCQRALDESLRSASPLERARFWAMLGKEPPAPEPAHGDRVPATASAETAPDPHPFAGLVRFALDELARGDGCCPVCCAPCHSLKTIAAAGAIDRILRTDAAVGDETWWDPDEKMVRREWLAARWCRTDCHPKPPVTMTLREARLAAGLTQAGLAKRMAMKQSQISGYETGTGYLPRPARLRRFAEVLGVDEVTV